MKYRFLLLLFCASAPSWALEFIFASDLHFHIDGLPLDAWRENAARLLADGPGKFLITGGDYDNFPKTEEAVEKYLLQPLREQGLDYPWYVVVGNHDPEWTANNWQENNNGSGRNIKSIIARNHQAPGVVNHGPAERGNLEEYRPDGAEYTTFSFDREEGHFVILDLYSAQEFENRWRGQADPALVDWLEKDLRQTRQKYIFVFAHEPLMPFDGVGTIGGEAQPIDPGDVLVGERERMLKLLQSDPRVVAYVAGHTHSYGIRRAGSLWLITAAQEWIEQKMLLRFRIDGKNISVVVSRMTPEGYSTEEIPLR